MKTKPHIHLCVEVLSVQKEAVHVKEHTFYFVESPHHNSDKCKIMLFQSILLWSLEREKGKFADFCETRRSDAIYWLTTSLKILFLSNRQIVGLYLSEGQKEHLIQLFYSTNIFESGRTDLVHPRSSEAAHESSL